MSEEVADPKDNQQVEPKMAIDMKDDGLEKIVGGTPAAKRATDLQTESAGTQITNSFGHYSQMVWGKSR